MRAKWDLKHEELLMEAYFAARCDANLRSERGIRARAWLSAMARVRAAGAEVDREQCKTKFARIMVEYAALKDACEQYDVDWDEASNTPRLSDEAWRAVIAANPRMAALYHRVRIDGFPHRRICSLITGDTPTSEGEERRYRLAASVAPSEDADRASESGQTHDESDAEDSRGRAARKRGVETLGEVATQRSRSTSPDLSLRREQFVRRLQQDEKQHADRMAMEREKLAARAEAEQRNRELVLQCVSLFCEAFGTNRDKPRTEEPRR